MTDRNPKKVIPKPALYVEASSSENIAEFCEKEPYAFVGGPRETSFMQESVTPTASTVFGPRGALIGKDSSLWVCDTGHHRLLGWSKMPDHDGTPAQILIGQRDFNSEGRNGKGEVSAHSLNVPTGLCQISESKRKYSGLAVADAWNHRVLIWSEYPRDLNQPADLVIGQTNFKSGESNQGGSKPGPDTMHWPYGVAFLDGKLLVADAGNRRVLVWNELPTENGQPADVVLGQVDFFKRDENGGHEPDATSMRWPHGVTLWDGRLCVCDAGNNRIMVWNLIPAENGTPCDFVLGQADFGKVDHNQSLYYPRAFTLNMPYGATTFGTMLLVADTANSRIVAYESTDLVNGMNARGLLGQPTFNDKGDNRWSTPKADSLCWPYAVDASDQALAIADSGNNRVSLWNLKQ